VLQFTLVTVERIFAVATECLVALGTDKHIVAVETIHIFALIAIQTIALLAIEAEYLSTLFTVKPIFTFIAEFFVALGTLCSIHALVTF
jgi:hypothetical protein